MGVYIQCATATAISMPETRSRPTYAFSTGFFGLSDSAWRLPGRRLVGYAARPSDSLAIPIGYRPEGMDYIVVTAGEGLVESPQPGARRGAPRKKA